MDTWIYKLGVSELNSLYRKKELSPVEVTSLLLDYAREEDKYNAFVCFLDETAMNAAKASEKRFMMGEPSGLVDGIPFAVKDNFYTRNAKTTLASRLYQDFQPEYNAAVIDQLEAGGAILLGKTNTHEFACSPTCDVSIFGPVANPHSPRHTAAGSSGGSAAALAANLIPAALGSDTGGSVRIPAAACGVVGMRPTQGLLSRFGVYPLSYSIDNIGPMTRSVLDNAIMLEAMVGYDYRDERSIAVPEQNFTDGIERSLKDIKIAIPEDLGCNKPIESEIIRATHHTVEILQEMGATVQLIPPLDPDGIYEEACRTIRICEAFSVHKKDLEKRGDLYTPEIYEQMTGGAKITVDEYIEAGRKRLQFQIRFTELMNTYDAAIIPTIRILPPVIGERDYSADGKHYPVTVMLTCNTMPASLSGYPAITIPVGISRDGRPIGIQIMTKRFGELCAYHIAYQLESAMKPEYGKPKQ